MSAYEYNSASLKPPFIREFLELWQYRDLLRLLVTNSIKTRYKRSTLGVVWTLLNPILTMLVLTLVQPVVLAEFGWYGGTAKPKFDKGAHPIGTEEQQAKYLRRAVETSAGFAVGWLNWGLHDHPGAGRRPLRPARSAVSALDIRTHRGVFRCVGVISHPT